MSGGLTARGTTFTTSAAVCVVGISVITVLFDTIVNDQGKLHGVDTGDEGGEVVTKLHDMVDGDKLLSIGWFPCPRGGWPYASCHFTIDSSWHRLAVQWKAGGGDGVWGVDRVIGMPVISRTCWFYRRLHEDTQGTQSYHVAPITAEAQNRLGAEQDHHIYMTRLFYTPPQNNYCISHPILKQTKLPPPSCVTLPHSLTERDDFYCTEVVLLLHTCRMVTTCGDGTQELFLCIANVEL